MGAKGRRLNLVYMMVAHTLDNNISSFMCSKPSEVKIFTNVTMYIVKMHILGESRLSATMHQKSAQTQQSMDCNRLYID